MSFTLGDYLGFLGVILGVISIYATVYSTKEKKPQATVVEQAKVAGSKAAYANAIKVEYKGEPVSNVRVLGIVFWNAGRAPILKSEVSQRTPFSVVFNENATVLDWDIVGCSRDDVNPVVSPNNTGKGVDVHFDFLDHQDWIRIRVLYTADSSAFDVRGVVIGGKTLRLDKKESDLLGSVLLAMVITWGALYVGSWSHDWAAKLLGSTVFVYKILNFMIGYSLAGYVSYRLWPRAGASLPTEAMKDPGT